MRFTYCDQTSTLAPIPLLHTVVGIHYQRQIKFTSDVIYVTFLFTKCVNLTGKQLLLWLARSYNLIDLSLHNPWPNILSTLVKLCIGWKHWWYRSHHFPSKHHNNYVTGSQKLFIIQDWVATKGQWQSKMFLLILWISDWIHRVKSQSYQRKMTCNLFSTAWS